MSLRSCPIEGQEEITSNPPRKNSKPKRVNPNKKMNKREPGERAETLAAPRQTTAAKIEPAMRLPLPAVLPLPDCDILAFPIPVQERVPLQHPQPRALLSPIAIQDYNVEPDFCSPEDVHPIDLLCAALENEVNPPEEESEAVSPDQREPRVGCRTV